MKKHIKKFYKFLILKLIKNKKINNYYFYYLVSSKLDKRVFIDST